MNPSLEELDRLCHRFLQEGYAYEELNTPYVSDNMWNTLCRILDHNKDRLPQWFKDLYPIEMLPTTSAAGTKWRECDIRSALDNVAKYGEWNLDAVL